MSAIKTTTLFCAAAATLMTVANRTDAADVLRLLATVAHQQAESAGADLEQTASDESALKPSLAGQWSGQFVSDMDGVKGLMEADLQQTADGRLMGLLPYIEQDNLYKFQVTAGDVNGDGTCDIFAKAVTADGGELFLQIQGAYLPAVQKVQKVQPAEQKVQKVQPSMLVGTYEIFSIDGRGNPRTEDAGTLGIIAILIGL